MENKINIKKELTIIYHYPCYDGSLAAINTYLYYNHFSGDKYKISLMPLKNTYACFSKIKTKPDKIILVDLGLKDEDISFLTNKSNDQISIVIFDHHISSYETYIKEYKSKIENRKHLKIFYDEKNIKSACGLTFEYYKNKALNKKGIDKKRVEAIFNDNVKEINSYIEDADTGKNKMKNIDQFRSALAKQFAPLNKTADFSYNRKEKMAKFLEITPSYLIKIGEKYLKDFKKKAKNVLLKNYIYIVELKGGLKFLCCITEEKYVRGLACPFLAKISKKRGFLPIASFVYSYENNLYKFSMRNSENDAYDLSEIAKKYGGGGHKNAAAFVMDYDGIDNLILGTINIRNDIRNMQI